MSRTAANDCDSVAPFQKVGACIGELDKALRIHEMADRPDEVFAALELIRERDPRFALTERQSELLEFIRAYHESEGRPPSYRCMAGALSTSLSSINNMVRSLVERGYVARMPGRRQSLVLIGKVA